MADVKRHNRALARQLGAAARAEAQQCFRNAVLALSAYDGDQPAFYIEGVLTVWHGLMEIDHGWLEIGDAIVDPTLDDCEATDYYPVFRYSMKEVLKHCHRRRTLPYYVHQEGGRRTMMMATRDVMLRFLAPEQKAHLIKQLEPKEEFDGNQTQPSRP